MILVKKLKRLLNSPKYTNNADYSILLFDFNINELMNISGTYINDICQRFSIFADL